MADNIYERYRLHGRRKYPVTNELMEKADEAARAVLGPGARFEIFSGGQERPFHYRKNSKFTSTRHNIDQTGQSRAGDIEFFDPQGNKVSGPQLAKIGQYWAAKGYGGVGLEMGRGGIHLDLHKDKSPFWTYGRHKRASSGIVNAGLEGDPGKTFPLTQSSTKPAAPAPTTPGKPASVPLSDTPVLADFQKPEPQAPYNPNSTFKLIFPEGSQTQEAAAPQALPLQQTSPTSQPPSLKVAAMAPNIKTPKAPKLAATSESGAFTLVKMIRDGKDIKGLNPDFDALTPAQQANIVRAVRGADTVGAMQMVKELESQYPALAQPLGKTPKAAAAPKAASPAESIVQQSLKASDGTAPRMEGAPDTGKYKGATVKKDKDPPVNRGTLSPADAEAGVPNVPVRPGATPRSPSEMPGTPKEFGTRSGASYAGYVADQGGNIVRRPPAVSPMGAAATGAAGLAIGAVAGGRRNPETGVEDELPPGAGVGTGGIDDTGGMGGGSGPPNTATRTIEPGGRLGPEDGSPRPPGAAAAPPSDGSNIANEMIERTLGLPRGSLNSPQGQQALATIRQRIEAKAAANPAETVKRVQQAAQADAAQAAAPRQPQMRPPVGDMGGSPTSYTDRMTDLAAQNPGMAQLFQYFAGAGGE